MKRGQSSVGEEGDGEDESSSNILRVSKACKPSLFGQRSPGGDPCRARKVRCDIATQAICSECVRRNQAEQCTLREKARPNRYLFWVDTLLTARSAAKKPERESRTPTTLHRQTTDEAYPPPSPPMPHAPRLGSFRNTKPTAEPRAKPVSAAVSVETMLEAEASRLFGGPTLTM